MNLLIPMAGEGRRFKEEGFKDPKPMIPVLGQPMIIRAAESFPDCSSKIFVMRDFHVSNYGIDDFLKKNLGGVEVVTVKELTDGQASTCLLAREFFDNEEELYIGACDNAMIYDSEKLKVSQSRYDALVYSFRHNPTVVHKPQQYGWAETNGTDVLKMSVKVPVSDDPINDHAVVGAFWFRHGRDFVRSAESMMARDGRVNGEFYVDELFNDAIQLGLKVGVFEIDKYICWGTPDDLRTFNYWKEYHDLLKGKIDA